MTSWTAIRSKLRQILARNSQVSGFRLRELPILRILKDPRSTDPYSRSGRPYRLGSASSLALIASHSVPVNCLAAMLTSHLPVLNELVNHSAMVLVSGV